MCVCVCVFSHSHCCVASSARRELEQASLTIMQMDAKIKLLSSSTSQSDEKVDIRIARERVIMQQALDDMRAHMSEVLDSQRRDAARELKALREDMTEKVLMCQIDKERAEEKLAELLETREGVGKDDTLRAGGKDDVEGGVEMSQVWRVQTVPGIRWIN